jgi:hypothetical protein
MVGSRALAPPRKETVIASSIQESDTARTRCPDCADDLAPAGARDCGLPLYRCAQCRRSYVRDASGWIYESEPRAAGPHAGLR